MLDRGQPLAERATELRVEVHGSLQGPEAPSPMHARPAHTPLHLPIRPRPADRGPWAPVAYQLLCRPLSSERLLAS